jgi:hypothetical protein
MGLYHSPRIVTNGLVLALDAADRNSYPTTGTTWFDLAGSSNGTLTNGPTFNAGSGGSIVFDGTNDYTQLSSTSSVWQTNNEMTIISTFKLTGWPDSFAQNRAPLIIKSSGSTSFEFALWVNGNVPNWAGNPYSTSFECWTFDGAGSVILTSAPQNSFSLNTVYTVAGVYKGNSSPYGLLYINGNLISSTATKSGTMTTGSAPVRIAGRLPDPYVAGGQYLNGYVYNTQIYNRALTTAEIQQNFNALRGRFGI